MDRLQAVFQKCDVHAAFGMVFRERAVRVFHEIAGIDFRDMPARFFERFAHNVEYSALREGTKGFVRAVDDDVGAALFGRQRHAPLPALLTEALPGTVVFVVFRLGLGTFADIDRGDFAAARTADQRSPQTVAAEEFQVCAVRLIDNQNFAEVVNDFRNRLDVAADAVVVRARQDHGRRVRVLLQKAFDFFR